MQHPKLESYSDVEALVANGATETKFLDFKRGAPLTTEAKNEDKAEFVRDVSAFANADGGVIIYGVDEDKKTQTFTCNPFELADPDKEVLRLQQILNTGARPRIHGLDIRALKIESINRFFIRININPSLSAPHMVAFDRSFYIRTSAGKQPMEVEGLKSAFLATGQFSERAELWRTRRIEQIYVTVREPVLFIHCIPLGFGPGLNLSLADVGKRALPFMVPFGRSMAMNLVSTYALEGFEVLGARSSEQGPDVVRFLREGPIESVFLLDDKEHYAQALELELMKSISNYLKAFQAIDLSPPVAIAVSIISNDYLHLKTRDIGLFNLRPLKPGRNFFPLLFADEWTSDDAVPSLCRPLCDAIWNALGQPLSPSYDSNGLWRYPWS